MDARWFDGRTTEGRTFEATCFYRSDDPAGAAPIRIVGSYGAADGGGTFDVSSPAELPAVVAEGSWHQAGGVDNWDAVPVMVA